MKIIDIIEKKKHGHALNEEEIKYFIDGVTKGTIEDYQISALLMAIYFRGMNTDETVYLTKYMAYSGEVLNLEDISNDITDKHSTGGVGDKITLMFLPIIASAGLYAAKLSGRGLGHTGGTIDKLESIPGFRTDLSIDEFKAKVKEHKTAIAAQTMSLAPADGKLYALRDVTSTVDIIPLIASSVVSKKIASGANHIILDVKYGSGAFIKTPEDAEKLSKIMVETGKRLSRNISAVISSMQEPLGRAIGNSVEIQEVIEFLKGNMESDLKEVTYMLCSQAFEKSGKILNKEEAYKYIDELIQSGKALEKFKEIIKSQSGDERIVNDYSLLPQAKIKYEVKTDKTGFVSNIDALKAAKACKNLGAGREKKTDTIDYSAGIYLTKKTQDEVKPFDTIAVLYTNKETALNEAEELVKSAFEITNTKPHAKSLIYKVIN